MEEERGRKRRRRMKGGGRGLKLVCGWNGAMIVRWILSDKGEEEKLGGEGALDGWMDALTALRHPGNLCFLTIISPKC